MDSKVIVISNSINKLYSAGNSNCLEGVGCFKIFQNVDNLCLYTNWTVR